MNHEGLLDFIVLAATSNDSIHSRVVDEEYFGGTARSVQDEDPKRRKGRYFGIRR